MQYVLLQERHSFVDEPANHGKVWFKVARTSFLARGIDFLRVSRVRNTHDKGGARDFFFAQELCCTVGREIHSRQ